MYVRASKQVRVWLGAQAKGRSEESFLAWGSACAKALWLGNRVKGYVVGVRLDCSSRTWPAGMMAQGGCPGPAPSCLPLSGHPQALQLQRRTKVMAKCISPSAGHSSSTNVLIVGAGWWWGYEGQGGVGGEVVSDPPHPPHRCSWLSVCGDTAAGGVLRQDRPVHTGPAPPL